MRRIDREHPEYVRRRAMWRKYSDLYAGGEQLRANAASYLVRRSKELGEVYQERLSRVFYENYAGAIVDWYAATLMRREPVLLFEDGSESGRRFFTEFIEDCDLEGTNLPEFFRQRFIDAMVYGRAYTAVEFPRRGESARNRAEEDATGRSRAYLVAYTPENVINWSRDAEGRLEWVVLRTSALRQESPDDDWREETRWIYYDRENFEVYAQLAGGENGDIRRIDRGRHGLAGLKRVPVFELKVSDGLWLLNKCGLLQLEHFNKSNALAWALTMGLFAMPVIYSEREWNQIAGESYYIQLGPEDKFGWTEPEGHVYQIAADNLTRLKDEIYRVCYLISQAGAPQTANGAQSGLSKLRDFSITHEVLRAYGDAVKESLKQVLQAVADARQDGMRVAVSGLDEFDIGDFSSELDDARKLLELGVPSATLKKQVFKKLAFKYLCDAGQAVKGAVAEEIERGS